MAVGTAVRHRTAIVYVVVLMYIGYIGVIVCVGVFVCVGAMLHLVARLWIGFRIIGQVFLAILLGVVVSLPPRPTGPPARIDDIHALDDRPVDGLNQGNRGIKALAAVSTRTPFVLP